jgi:ribosome assembly protein RRB1
VFKLSNIKGKKREPIPSSKVDAGSDMDSDSSSDEEDEEETNEDIKPILHVCILTECMNPDFALTINCSIP